MIFKTIKEHAKRETIKEFFSGNCILIGQEQSPMIDYAVETALKDVKKLINELGQTEDSLMNFIEELKARINGETFEEHKKNCGCCDNEIK